MQNERTLQFWDNFYNDQEKQLSNTKEWILYPTDALVDQLLAYLPDKPLRILEIGCGSSTLARDLWIRHSSSDSEHPMYILATDASPVCILQNQKRDDSVLQAGHLEYAVLNIAEDHSQYASQFDAILDKGCLDTFLFRSKQRGSGKKSYSPLVQTVLENVHSWLRDDGVYFAMTPRPKLKSARDFTGFCSFERHNLTGKAEKANLEGKEERTFLYMCRKNTQYDPTRAFSVERELVKDDDVCQKCKGTFLEYRKGEALWGRGEAFWHREWKGHCIHCKG